MSISIPKNLAVAGDIDVTGDYTIDGADETSTYLTQAIADSVYVTNTQLEDDYISNAVGSLRYIPASMEIQSLQFTSAHGGVTSQGGGAFLEVGLAGGMMQIGDTVHINAYYSFKGNGGNTGALYLEAYNWLGQADFGNFSIMTVHYGLELTWGASENAVVLWQAGASPPSFVVHLDDKDDGIYTLFDCSTNLAGASKVFRLQFAGSFRLT